MYESWLGESRGCLWDGSVYSVYLINSTGDSTMITWLLNKLSSLTTCDIDIYFGKLDRSMQIILDRCTKIEKQLEHEIRMLTEEVATYKGMLHAVAETLPDMMWCKDINGKYIYANMAIKTGLLFDMNPEGKCDIELATVAKSYFGSDNHTFGEKCKNSDLIVIETKQPQRFLESGKIKGKMVYLEVFKAPFFVNGELRGVVGTGRDMTEYVEAYREQNCGGCGRMADIFKKYEYGE